jgi:hypothetical protein
VQDLPALDTPTLDLLIVDVDQGVKSDWSLLETLRGRAHLAPLPIVTLSWESPADCQMSSRESETALPTSLSSRSTVGQAQGAVPTLSLRSSKEGIASDDNVTCLSKPFDARALHSTIAKLLAERATRKAAQVAVVEAQVLASYEQRAAPSIWPVVTAAGLLLVVIGLLLHFVVVLVGMVIMLTSLLLWTLGTKPTPSVSSSTGVVMSNL